MGRGQPGSRDTSESRGWLSVSLHMCLLCLEAGALLQPCFQGITWETPRNSTPQAGSFGGSPCLSAVPEQEAPLPDPRNGSDCILPISCQGH